MARGISPISSRKDEAALHLSGGGQRRGALFRAVLVGNIDHAGIRHGDHHVAVGGAEDGIDAGDRQDGQHDVVQVEQRVAQTGHAIHGQEGHGLRLTGKCGGSIHGVPW